MEGHFRTDQNPDLVFIGQPNVEEGRIDNAIVLPGGLSFLIYQNWTTEVKGLDSFPRKNWPDNIPLLYYSYHVMVGLGTIFIGIMVIAAALLFWRRTLFRFRPMLWVLMLATPFPFIANTAGWLTAELGRQPWLAYGLFRTSEGVSPLVSSGSVFFTLIGFMGMYLIMGLLYVLLMVREVAHGPEAEARRLRGEPRAPRRRREARSWRPFWFIAVAFMITMYVLLDGFDLGAGAIHLVAARDERERRTILRAIGPVWDGNEVWLIAAGGTLFFAFPLLYASGFSGFYLPLIIVLWLLMIRGLSIELRTHIDDPMWATFWDCDVLLRQLAAGDLLRRGVGQRGARRPAHWRRDYFFQPLWTNFSPFSQEPGILDWYTILVAVLALVTLIAHGANWISLKTEDDLNARSRRISRTFALATAVLTVLVTPLTFWVSPWMLESFGATALRLRLAARRHRRAGRHGLLQLQRATIGRPSSPPAPTSSGC